MSVEDLTPMQLAGRWGLTLSALDDRRGRGRTPHARRVRGRLLYRLADVVEFEANWPRHPDQDWRTREEETLCVCRQPDPDGLDQCRRCLRPVGAALAARYADVWPDERLMEALR